MKKIAVLLTTVLTAGMLAACGQGKNAETTSAGVSDVKTEADSVPEAKPEKDAINWEWWTRMEAISIREPWPLRKK